MILTVDVESDWGTGATRGVQEALPRLLDLLARFDARATFFVVGLLAGEVRRHLDPSGPHEVASHGLTHTVLTRLPLDRAAHEVAESRRRLTAAGYDVQGFRAPFLRAPRALPELLAHAGYRYDCSLGSVVPSLRNLRRLQRTVTAHGIVRVRPGTLRDGITPFSLTWLRLLHPLGLRLCSRSAGLFYCHLHELLDGQLGWVGLPKPLRRLHARHAGATAWRILEQVLHAQRGRTILCREGCLA